jgi:hypothetical protein
MLRHIISVSLAMAACASLIPTKANAISLTLTPLGSLQRNPGDTISFILGLDPQGEGGLSGVRILEVYQPSLAVFSPGPANFDSRELSSPKVQPFFDFSSQPVTVPRDIAALIFTVTNPIKDGKSDVITTRISYWSGNVETPQVYTYDSSNFGLDVQPVPTDGSSNSGLDVKPVPTDGSSNSGLDVKPVPTDGSSNSGLDVKLFLLMVPVILDWMYNLFLNP